jgi:urease beta subunit
MPTQRLLLFLAALLAGIGAAAGEPPDLAGVLAGDRWLYDVTDEITGEAKYTSAVVVIDVSEKEILARVSSRGNPRPRQVAFDHGWSRIDDEVWKFAPSDGTGLRLPLEVGKAWRFENNARNLVNGVTLRTTGQSKVVDQETTTTGAGTFQTFKVETTIRYVYSNDATKAATVTSTMWYAPTVNRWVRKTYKLMREGRLRESNTEELTDYSRKP